MHACSKTNKRKTRSNQNQILFETSEIEFSSLEQCFRLIWFASCVFSWVLCLDSRDRYSPLLLPHFTLLGCLLHHLPASWLFFWWLPVVNCSYPIPVGRFILSLAVSRCCVLCPVAVWRHLGGRSPGKVNQSVCPHLAVRSRHLSNGEPNLVCRQAICAIGHLIEWWSQDVLLKYGCYLFIQIGFHKTCIL